MDYRAAGVDLAAAELLVQRLADTVTSTWTDDVVTPFGGFAAGLRLPEGYRRPVLMMTTDGVGTKAEVARQADLLDGLGFDLVAMCVDDLAASGARPLGLVDYLSVGRLDRERDERLVASIARACQKAGCALLGGETAEHPGVMEPDRFDLAGAALGIAEENEIVDGSRIETDDVILGLESPNLRSNGFSLVRAAVLSRLGLSDPFPGADQTVAEVLLEPSVLYAPAIVPLLAAFEIHGLAHVTGGGLAANLARVLPPGRQAMVERGSWSVPEVFGTVQELGQIPPEEMKRTFNMGIGFVVVLSPDAAADVVSFFDRAGHTAWEIGRIEEGEGVRLS